MDERTAIAVLDRWRQQLARTSAEDYARTLEQAGDDRQLRMAAVRVLPELASVWDRRIDRRRMLQLLGATLAIAGASGCRRQPPEAIVPYVEMPEGIVPGEPQFYTTALDRAGLAEGVIVRTRLGRPIKVDGNPAHPASLGATDVRAQAAAVELYDPDRSRAVLHRGQIRSRDALERRLARARDEWVSRRGAGLALLTGEVTSPTLLQQIEALLERLPQARWFVHEPVSRRNERRGCELALGRALVPIYDFTQAEVIVSLDGDFLDTMPGHLRYARDFAGGRRALHPPARVLRLHAIESAPTLTGAVADHRVAVPPSGVVAVAHALAETLGALPAGAPTQQSLPIAADTLAAISADLSAHRGRSVIVPGPAQPPPVHLLAHVLNTALGNVGTTVRFIAPPEAGASSNGSLEDLSEVIGSGSIDSLVALETNPAYTAPAGARFAERLGSLRFSVHCGRYADETAESCQWHAPAPHPFESWSDLRAYDGTATIVQPVLDPLFPTQSPHEILELLTTGAARDARAIVRESWQSRWQQQAGPHADVGFERRWHEALASGVVAGSASALESPTLADDWATHLPAVHTAGGLELRFVPDPSVWDGAHANSAWLQELPRPLTSLVWSNALLIDPVLARDLAQGGPVLRNGDHVRIRHADHELTVPVWITPGAAPRTLTLALGYGRRRAGRVGSGLGFDAYALRPRENAWFVPDVEVLPVDGRTSLVTVQHHHDQHDRELAREMRVAQFRAGVSARRPEVAAAAERSLYGEIDRHGEYAWGMTIDLSACIGCNACTIACQAENNIPAVGPEEVREGHEMHWIRVDRYRGRAGPDRDLFQPVPCMHCEKAPCEYVCPVEAAIHDSEGLNLQIYNRCIGTRDCSQNCPYKVRRFNWRDYNYDPDDPKTIPPAAVNPEVTVRSRGVMEKCTYCVQRISRARIDAKLEDRRIADAEVVPACAAVCPSRAISFGDLQDADAEVVRWRTSSRHYVLLEELGTRPRTTYLAALTNPLSQREPEAETGNTPAGRPRGERS